MANRRYVVISNTTRGIYFGEVEQAAPDEKGQIVVYNLRHCFGWKAHPEAPGVWGLTVKGPQAGSQIGPVVKRIVVCNVANVADCEPEAVEAWKNATWSS